VADKPNEMGTRICILPLIYDEPTQMVQVMSAAQDNLERAVTTRGGKVIPNTFSIEDSFVDRCSTLSENHVERIAVVEYVKSNE
jgi:hypothetical protein